MRNPKRYVLAAVVIAILLLVKFQFSGSGPVRMPESQGADRSTSVHHTAADVTSILPRRYDLREQGRAPQVKDQGSSGTCWAFASLTALESALLPETPLLLSTDHMKQNNSFSSTGEDGGQYTMAMAYLASWQGPVKESDDAYGGTKTDAQTEQDNSPGGKAYSDAYGSGKTDAQPKPVRHVQDMQIIEAKDLEAIKEAVFQYGGVESCIFMDMHGAGSSSPYYNSGKYAYCYTGEKKSNHDIVIIGWDDYFPKEHFGMKPAKDGAFICQNSWGSGFGEDGVFYVSYYDANIGMHSLAYTRVDDTDNYDRLYQSDLCGWVGQMGFNEESMYGANVFQAQETEDIAAAGFYTTDRDTSYRVYIVPEFTDKDSLRADMPIAEGKYAQAGYHTVDFGQPVRVEQGNKFAVIVWLSTPNALHPMAIEYAADEATQQADLSDGEGYVSAQGRIWTDAGQASGCNLCIKAYARSAQGN